MLFFVHIVLADLNGISAGNALKEEEDQLELDLREDAQLKVYSANL
jgi:hypothetical protein